MKKWVYFFITFNILTLFGFGQTFNPVLASKLQNTIDSVKTANNIKGISVSVIYPGQGMWLGVTGESYTGVPITSDMEFAIASNTKLFTGVITLKLAESGIINLDDSLHSWLPPFTNVDSNITIRQLLNHTSGLADVNDVVGYVDSISIDPNRVFTPTEIMSWVGTSLFAAGTSWNYSNTDYLLAAMIAETATGFSFGQLLHDSILTPLQLDSTFLDVYDTVLGTIVHPWQSGIDKSTFVRTALNSAAWSSGGMYSTASEMAQWYWALMNGQVLSSNAFDELTTFVGSGNYGVGLIETSILGRTVWQHGGTILGYNSTMLYDTTTHAVICVLINQNPAQSFLVAQELLTTIVNNPLTISEKQLTENDFVVYPNPTDDIIKLSIESQKVKGIKLYDNNGVLIREYSTTEISISDLSSGQYFIVVQTDKKVATKKIIKY